MAGGFYCPPKVWPWPSRPRKQCLSDLSGYMMAMRMAGQGRASPRVLFIPQSACGGGRSCLHLDHVSIPRSVLSRLERPTVIDDRCRHCQHLTLHAIAISAVLDKMTPSVLEWAWPARHMCPRAWMDPGRVP